MEAFLAGNASLGLISAVFWGIGDFSGGMGVKSAGGSTGAALRVVLLSHLASFSVLIVLATLFGGPFPQGAPLAWGLAAGIAGGLSLSAFYIALSRGEMGTSAAISGLLAAFLPAVVSAFSEGTPGWRRGIGFMIAGAAIWMIAAGKAEREEASTAWLAIAAGAGFGLYFICLKHAGAAGWVWPMACARVGSITTCSLLLLGLRSGGRSAQVARVGKQALGWVLGTALFDTSGNLLFVAASRAGRLDVAAVLASLYPASTILLAAWMLKERPTQRQGWGMAVALVAVVLIAA